MPRSIGSPRARCRRADARGRRIASGNDRPTPERRPGDPAGAAGALSTVAGGGSDGGERAIGLQRFVAELDPAEAQRERFVGNGIAAAFPADEPAVASLVSLLRLRLVRLAREETTAKARVFGDNEINRKSRLSRGRSISRCGPRLTNRR